MGVGIELPTLLAVLAGLLLLQALLLAGWVAARSVRRATAAARSRRAARGPMPATADAQPLP